MLCGRYGPHALRGQEPRAFESLRGGHRPAAAGPGLQGVGGGLLVPVVEVVPPTAEPTTSSEAASTTIHGLRFAGGVHLLKMYELCQDNVLFTYQLEGGIVLLIIVRILGSSSSILTLVLGHVPASINF